MSGSEGMQERVIAAAIRQVDKAFLAGRVEAMRGILDEIEARNMRAHADASIALMLLHQWITREMDSISLD